MLSQKDIEDRAIRTDKKLLEIVERIRGNSNKNIPLRKRSLCLECGDYFCCKSIIFTNNVNSVLINLKG